MIKQHNSTHCTVAIFKLLGDFWMLQIIQVLKDGEKRFCELERALPTINPTTLSNRLKKMESEQILSKREKTIDQLSVSYALTQKGRDTLPILQAIHDFAATHFS